MRNRTNEHPRQTAQRRGALSQVMEMNNRVDNRIAIVIWIVKLEFAKSNEKFSLGLAISGDPPRAGKGKRVDG